MTRTLRDYAQAIRDGAKDYPQAFNVDFRYSSSGWSLCAHGALVLSLEPAYAEAVFGNFRNVLYHGLDAQEHPALFVPASCPVEDCGDDGIASIEELVVHLNDIHQWMPDEIADHLVALDGADEGEWR